MISHFELNLECVEKYILSFSVAFLHIFASGFDQFVENVLRREGEMHQVHYVKGRPRRKGLNWTRGDKYNYSKWIL